MYKNHLLKRLFFLFLSSSVILLLSGNIALYALDHQFFIAGSINDEENGLADVELSLESLDNRLFTTQSDWDGNYLFTGIPYKPIFILTPYKTGYVFSPPERIVIFGRHKSTDLDFEAKKMTTWEKKIGAGEIDMAFSAEQTSDGGYIIGGMTNYYDFLIIKTDALGNETWRKVFGGEGFDYVYDVRETRRGDFVIMGGGVAPGTEISGILVLKLNADGEEIWHNYYGSPDMEIPYGMNLTLDSGCIITGTRTIESTGKTDAFLLKLDRSGNEIWMKYFGEHNQTGNSVIQTFDLGYMFTGTTQIDDGVIKARLTKTDAYGNVKWIKDVSGGFGDFAREVVQNIDGGYTVTGGALTAESLSSDTKGFLLRVDRSGNEIWHKTFDNNATFFYTLDKTADCGFVTAGSMVVPGTNDNDMYLVKTDADGNEIWRSTFDAGLSDVIYSIRQTKDRGYIVSGIAWTSPENQYDMWVLKLNNEGKLSGE